MNAAVLGWAERRRFARVPISERFGEATLGPRSGVGAPVPLLDFSPNGVSVVGARNAPWLSGHVPLCLRLLDWEIPCTSSIALDQGDRRGGGIGVGLRFDRDGQDQVARLYHRLRFPALHRRSAVPPGDVLRLLEESGYLDLGHGLVPDSTWMRAAWSSALSHEAIFRGREGRALGHLAVTRAYRNAWLGHEIATLSVGEEAAACRRDLYQHLCVWPRLLDGESTHVFAYYNAKRPIHQRMFEGFASRSSTDDCVVVRMERYLPEAERVRSDALARPPSALSVEPMPPEDELFVLDVFERYWPALALAAFDIGPDGLSQRTLHPSFAALGLDRGRECLVVRSGPAIVAILLCEWDDTRLSLFDALSPVRVFLVPGAPPTHDLEQAVVGAVRTFYSARGARVPLLTCPPGTFHRQDLPGFRWLETMDCIVLSARALRAFEAYVEISLDQAALEQGA